MQTYAIKMFNFMRFGEKNNTIVFDLSEDEKSQIASGKLTLDNVYDRVIQDPVAHVKNVKARGLESLIGIVGIIDGDPDSSNGAGKSTVMEAMCYGRYDKVARKIINSDKIEKAGTSVVTRIDGEYPPGLRESYTEEILEDKGIIYRIRRGRSFSKTQQTNSPIVEIECYNEEERDQRGGHRSGDTKDAIDEVIQMDYDVFVNSQMFAQNDAGKFLMGTDKTKKEMMISLLHLENIVAGCLELVRTKKNKQDKIVEGVKTKLVVLTKQLKESRDILFPQWKDSLTDFADDSSVESMSRVILKKIEDDVRQIEVSIALTEKEIAKVDQEITTLSTSDKVTKLEHIKEKGSKAIADKKQKEQDMLSNKKKWETLIASEEKEKSNNVSFIAQAKKTILSKEQQIATAKAKIDKFNPKEAEDMLVKIAKAKEAKPKFELQIEQDSKLRDGAFYKKAGFSNGIQDSTAAIRKFTKQLDIGGDTFVCSECESVVSREHVESKMAEAKKKHSSLEVEVADAQKIIAECEAKIKANKEKILKCESYIQKESGINSDKELQSILKTQIANANAEIGELLKNIGVYESTIIECEDKIKRHKDGMEKELEIFKKFISASEVEIEKLMAEYRAASEEAKVIKTKIEDLNKKKTELNGIKSASSKKLGSLSQEEKQIKTLVHEIDAEEGALVREEKELSRYKVLEGVYGLDGIQTRIIRKYLPLLNVYIKEFLDILTEGEMSVNLFINERSKVDLAITGGTSDTYEMLSGGEKMVVRLATDIGLALLSFTRSSQKPEVICLDEIFGPLDNSRTAAVFKMLEHLRDKFSRVLLITHKSDIKEMIPTNIVIEKTSGRLGYSEVKRIE